MIETAPTPKMNDANAEIPFPMLPDQYVTCFSWLGPLEHEELWSEWLACYLEGKPAQVTIEVILSPIFAIYRLTATSWNFYGGCDMTREEMEDMTALDEAAEHAGGYVSPPLKDNIHYDYRKLIAYCKDRGIDPRELTIRELDKFIIPEN